MDGYKKGAVVKKFEQLMIVVENRIYPLYIFGEIRKISVLFEVAPSFAFAYFFPTFHRLFRLNNENRILGNQVNGLQVGFGRKYENIGQIAQIQYQ